PFGREVERAGQDAGVVGVRTESSGQHLRVGVVELDVQRSSGGPDGYRRVQPPVPESQLVEGPQGFAGEPTELRVMPFALQLADHDQRKHHAVLGEPSYRPRIGQQDRGVQNIGANTPGTGHLTVAWFSTARGAFRLWLGTSCGHGYSLAGAASAPARRRAGPAPAAGWADWPPTAAAGAGHRPLATKVDSSTVRTSHQPRSGASRTGRVRTLGRPVTAHATGAAPS